MSLLGLAMVPHLIPAGTIPAGLLERAMTEPLADGRDEVIYLIATHRRVALGAQVTEGWRNVYRARGGIGGPFEYDMNTPWAQVRFPDGVRPSALGWAVLDPLLESYEGLNPDPSFDPERDVEGEDGRHRQELLAWIYDRHIELDNPPSVDRGEAEGGEMDFHIQYVGKSNREALRRAAGPHHKMSLVLHKTLTYDPHRLVYPMPCDVLVGYSSSDDAQGSVEMIKLNDAAVETGLPRDLLIAAAEEAAIAILAPPENHRNTGTRRFPRSDAGDRLLAAGVTRVGLGIYGLPQRVKVRTAEAIFERGSRAVEFRLT